MLKGIQNYAKKFVFSQVMDENLIKYIVEKQKFRQSTFILLLEKEDTEIKGMTAMEFE